MLEAQSTDNAVNFQLCCFRFVRKLIVFFHRLVDLQRQGKINIVSVIVSTDNKNRLNGLSKNVIMLKIEKVRQRFVIELD